MLKSIIFEANNNETLTFSKLIKNKEFINWEQSWMWFISRCTVIYGTPTMFVDLINKQKERQENISPEIAVSGGALCAPQLFKNMLDVLKVRKVKVSV